VIGHEWWEDAYGLCNEVCILAVRSVPVASIEDADGVLIDLWERFEEADEAAFVVEL
jgi:hypothetical protein